jgi:hypothetical protein
MPESYIPTPLDTLPDTEIRRKLKVMLVGAHVDVSRYSLIGSGSSLVQAAPPQISYLSHTT